MRIAFDHQIFGWQQYGGISRYMYELASCLSASHEEDVGIFSPLYVNSYLEKAPPSLAVHGVRVPAFRRSGRIYRAVNSIFARYAIDNFKPDIVHETYFSTVSIAPKKSKVVLTVYDMIDEIFTKNSVGSSIIKKEKEIAVRRADHVVCISESTRRDLIEMLDVDPSKTSVVHLGVSFASSSAAESIKIEGQKKFILYVGNRNGHKNFLGLLNAYAKSKDLYSEFDLICFGGGSLSAVELAYIKQLGLPAGKVLQVSGDDKLLAQFYQSATVFVYPSLYEGFGIPPLEAMNFGCPVLCSNTSSIPEVVGSAAIMFDPENFDSMSNAIEAVVGNCELQAELVEKGRQRVKSFSWQKCASETLDIYRRVNS